MSTSADVGARLGPDERNPSAHQHPWDRAAAIATVLPTLVVAAVTAELVLVPFAALIVLRPSTMVAYAALLTEIRASEALARCADVDEAGTRALIAAARVYAVAGLAVTFAVAALVVLPGADRAPLSAAATVWPVASVIVAAACSARIERARGLWVLTYIGPGQQPVSRWAHPTAPGR